MWIRTFVKTGNDFRFHMLFLCSPSSYFGNFKSHPQQPQLSVVSTSNLSLPDQAHWMNYRPKVKSLQKNTSRLWLEIFLWGGLKSQNLKWKELWILGEMKNGSTVQFSSNRHYWEFSKSYFTSWRHSPYKTALQMPATSLGVPRLPALLTTGYRFKVPLRLKILLEQLTEFKNAL